MAEFGYQDYLALLAKVDAAVGADEKGKTFEDLASYLLRALQGIDITARDVVTGSEEIDLVLWNARVDEVLRSWSDIILVECKNWSAKVGAKDLNWFVTKIADRGLRTGILFAAHGVTGDYGSASDPVGARHVIRTALTKGIRVITITMDDLRLITSLEDLRRLLKWRYSGIFVHNVLADWQPPAQPVTQPPPVDQVPQS